VWGGVSKKKVAKKRNLSRKGGFDFFGRDKMVWSGANPRKALLGGVLWSAAQYKGPSYEGEGVREETNFTGRNTKVKQCLHAIWTLLVKNGRGRSFNNVK